MVEVLDIYRTSRPNAPVFVFIHGGTWRFLNARDHGYPAEMFVDAGAHYVAIDFDSVGRLGGDLGALAAQVRNAVAWVHRNAESFGGDRQRLYVGGHSSGGHLAGVVLVSDNESWVYQDRPYFYGVGGSTGVVTEWQQFVQNQVRLQGGDITGPKLICIDLQPNATTQAPERSDILNVGGLSDAVFDCCLIVPDQ